MVRRYPEVRRALLDRLEDGVEHAGDGAERRVLPSGDAPQAVEVPEQLVRAVEEVDDHLAGPCGDAAQRFLIGDPNVSLKPSGSAMLKSR